MQQNPTDAAKRSELNQKVAEASSRPATGAGAIATIASAQFALGNHKAAEANLQKALQKAPDMPQVQELRKRIEFEQALTKLTAQAEQYPADPAVRQKLQKTVDQAANLKIASPQLLTKLAQAQQVSGNSEVAVKLADQALTIDPNLKQAQQVKIMAGRGR